MDDDPLQAFVRKSILEKRFKDVLRVADAAEALCLVEQPEIAGRLGLVVSRHSLAGIGGPAFVSELHTRMPYLPVLVLIDTSADRNDYTGDYVRFLARPILAEDMLDLAGEMMTQDQRKTA